jgi:hypothetical protein
MKGSIITLLPEDDANSVRDRIEWAKAERVVLVLPQAWRELDFERIKRAGNQLGVEVAIASNDLQQRLAAREVGLIAFNTVEQATQHRWVSNDEVEPIERPSPPRRFKPNTLRQFFPTRNWLSIGLRFVVALVALGVVVAAGLVLSPKAKISMTASSQPISTITSVTIDPATTEVDLANRVIPARRIDVVVEDRLGVETTGKRKIDRYRAQGRVTFFNNLSTPYLVPRNTVVRTGGLGNPARFVTLGDVEVPGGGRADAGIEAVDEGGIGNVPANSINQVEGVPSLAVRVINAGGTGGGGGDTVRAVTQADLDKVKRQLRQKLFGEAVEKMRQLPDAANSNLYIVPETLFIADVQDESADRFVTEQADVVNMSMRLQVAALAVLPSDLNAIAENVLRKKVPKGFGLLSARALRGDAAEEGTGNRTEYFIVAQGVAGAEIDESKLKRMIRGKTRAEAQTLLLQSYALNSSPRIVVEPSWWVNWVDRLPWVTLRIQTEIKRE